MIHATPILSALCLAVVCAPAAFAQSQPAPSNSQPAAEPQTMIDWLKRPPDQGGGIHFSKHFSVVFGGIKQGSGIALGPAVSTKFENGGFVQLKAEYSVKKFALFQARYDTPRFWSGRAMLINRARWEDARKLPLYRLGMDSPERHIDHSERKREFSSRLTMDVTPRFIVGGGYGVERFTTSDARIDLDEGDVALPPIEPLPGVFTRPWYGHAFVMTAWDSRDSESYNTRGQLFEARLHSFNDWKSAEPFQRFEGTAQQLVQTFRGRGIADVSARTWLSISRKPENVPFFLMPYLGGGDYLRAYATYRFRDRDALLLRGEYRWAVHKMVDVAGLYEAGVVGPKVDTLTFGNMAQSIGVGIRVHSKLTNLFRADVAYGREGVGFKVGISTGGNASGS
jgi:hypothetical protein